LDRFARSLYVLTHLVNAISTRPGPPHFPVVEDLRKSWITWDPVIDRRVFQNVMVPHIKPIYSSKGDKKKLK
jgi:hypothetical protein